MQRSLKLAQYENVFGCSLKVVSEAVVSKSYSEIHNVSSVTIAKEQINALITANSLY